MSTAINIAVVAKDRATKELRGMGRQIAQFGKVASTVFAGLSAAGLAIGGAFLKMTSGSVAWADAVDKLAIRTGIGREEIQKLLFALDQNNIKPAALESALDALARNLDDIAKAGSPAAEAFNTLGINVSDSEGKIRPTIDLFNDLRDGISKIENPLERAFLAQSIFGGGASELMPILSLTRDEFDKLRDAAPVISDDQIAKIVGVGDAWADLKKQMGKVRDEIVAELSPNLTAMMDYVSANVLPVLKEWSDDLRDVVKAFGELPEPIQTAITNIALVVTTILGASTVLRILASGLKYVFGPLLAGLSAPVLIFIGFLALMGAAIWSLYNDNEEFRTKVQEIWQGIKDFAESIFNSLKRFWDQWGDDISAGFSAVWNGIYLFSVAVFQAIADVISGALTTIRGVWEVFAGFLQGDWSRMWNGLVTIMEGLTDIIIGIAKGIFNGIDGIFGGLFSKALGWGGGLADGFIQGIGNAWGRVVKFIDDKVREITDQVKNVLGIKSPSKVFAGIGENMALGLREGFGDASMPLMAPAAVPSVGGNTNSASMNVSIYGASAGDNGTWEKQMNRYWQRATRSAGL